jgi:hypothetical protein
MQTIASEHDVIMAYRLILGREPENSAAVQNIVGNEISFTEMRDTFIRSVEFRHNVISSIGGMLKPLDWDAKEGLSRGYTYGRIEDAHYARNVEIRSRSEGSSDQTIACSTVDDFVRLTLDVRGRQQSAWVTPLPSAQEKRVVMDAVYG